MASAAGDDGVHVKYLNPHLLVAAFASEDRVHVHVMDAMTGQVVHALAHSEASGPVLAHVRGNKVLYTYWNTKAKRQELGSLLLMEGKLGKDVVLPFKDIPNISDEDGIVRNPVVFSQVFVAPGVVRVLSSTVSTAGAVPVHVLLGVDGYGLLAVPEWAVDPRRPEGKPTKAEVAERLVQYDPYLPLSPKLLLNYNQRLEGISSVAVAGGRLESTVLVVAAGDDLFVRVMAPAGAFDRLSSDFNAPLMLLMLLGLFVGVIVLHMLSTRKALSSAWK
jgi:hypothetical protein